MKKYIQEIEDEMVVQQELEIKEQGSTLYNKALTNTQFDQ